MQPLKNESRILVFTLSGLNETIENRYVLLSLTALYYPLIVLCNVTVIFTIISDKKLQCNVLLQVLYVWHHLVAVLREVKVSSE